MYDRILVPTDGSAGVARAVEHAAGLAAAHDADLHAVYVVNTASFASLPVETSWEGVDDMLRDEGHEALERVRELAAERGVDVEGAVLEGRPAREIVRYAESAGCDLVVMATHGRGGIDRLLLGSVTEHVVRASDVPVLTVRIGDEAEVAATVQADANDAVGDGGAKEGTGGNAGEVAEGEAEEVVEGDEAEEVAEGEAEDVTGNDADAPAE